MLATVGGIYISTISVQQMVGTMNRTTTDGQLAARSIDGAVRNGSEFQITTLPSTDQLLRVRTLDGSESGVWNCRALVLRRLQRRRQHPNDDVGR